MPNTRCTGLFTLAPSFGSTKYTRAAPAAGVLAGAEADGCCCAGGCCAPPHAATVASAAKTAVRMTIERSFTHMSHAPMSWVYKRGIVHDVVELVVSRRSFVVGAQSLVVSRSFVCGDAVDQRLTTSDQRLTTNDQRLICAVLHPHGRERHRAEPHAGGIE